MAKNKLAKFAEMETLENVFQPTHEEVFRTDYKLKGKWGEQVFGNDHPIVLEVGCGKGEYSVGLGELYPEKNFIGLDIKGARMWTGAKAAEENYDLLFFDELIYTIRAGLFDEQILLDYLKNEKPAHLEVILTGQQPSEELVPTPHLTPLERICVQPQESIRLKSTRISYRNTSAMKNK